MCKCTPSIRTAYCGKLGCEWPHKKPANARLVKTPTIVEAGSVSVFDDQPESSGASVMRELDDARIEIQRLRGKLEKLRGAMCYPASGVDQHWVYVSARVWHEVMGDIER